MSHLKALEQKQFDLLVVGGGINGAGIAREAAQRGLSVALIEKYDYGSGTTSRSTRLIHGGLRYLEHGELLLVLESLRERERLLRRSPHLVRPLRFIIPVYDGSTRSARLIRAGMVLYDLLSAGKGVPRHHAAGPGQLRELEQKINAPGLKGAFLYYDGQVNFPERLVMETLTDARRHGAVTANYCELLSFRMDGRRVSGARLRDRRTGEEAEARAAMTINAAGPWLEQLDALLPASRSRKLLAPTSGSHLAVRPFEGAPSDAIYFEARSDRRPVFVIPWQGLYLIGTTDIAFSGDPSKVRPSEAEVDYLLAETNAVLPRANLQRASILFTYAGVRALPYEETGETGALTRRHLFFDHEKMDGIPGIATILGGKLTTFRSLARDTVNRIARKVGRGGFRAGSSGDGAGTLPQFAAWPWQGPPEALVEQAAPAAAAHSLEPGQFVRLFEIYGEGAAQIIGMLDADPNLRSTVAPGSEVTAAEVVYAVRCEQARTIGDVLLRRTCSALAAGRGMAEAPAAADLLARELNWSAREKEAALAEYEAEINLVLPRF